MVGETFIMRVICATVLYSTYNIRVIDVAVLYEFIGGAL